MPLTRKKIIEEIKLAEQITSHFCKPNTDAYYASLISSYQDIAMKCYGDRVPRILFRNLSDKEFAEYIKNYLLDGKKKNFFPNSDVLVY